MRTLEDIIPPSRRKEAKQNNDMQLQRSGRSRFPYGTFIVVGVIIAASAGALVYFSNAEVDVIPNTVSAAVQSSFTAQLGSGDLPFEIITSQKVASQSVPASGTKTVSSPASGVITIYNSQTQSQRLVAKTRFATASGLVFRIRSAVTVPGGNADKPGSITATVYADQNGDSYNIGPSSFTLPGLASSPLASKVYARSSSAMTGGASGEIPVIDSETENQTSDTLISALNDELSSSIQAQVPQGYVLISGAATTTYEKLSPSFSSTTGEADVKVQGNVTAVVFPGPALAKAMAQSVDGLGYQGEPVALSNTKELKLTTSSFPTPDDQSFSFTLSGTFSLTYTIDAARIAATIAGETRSAAQVALTNYPEVNRAVLILRPFWRQTFPDDPASISVVVEGQD